MNKQEFENLTMRGNDEIGYDLYEIIEHFYISDSDYHRLNNPKGIYENKQSFCKRVFGGKVNTPKTILEKVISEAIKENNYTLDSHKTLNKKMLDQHAALIAEHYTVIAKW